jgi:hypothetical protein
MYGLKVKCKSGVTSKVLTVDECDTGASTTCISETDLKL